MTFYTIFELPEAYTGAAYQVTDTIFLLDEMQVYHMWENFRDVKALNRHEDDSRNPWLEYGGYYSYYLPEQPVQHMNLLNSIM